MVDHCRIGSLEIFQVLTLTNKGGSLPHRQLRKEANVLGVTATRSLPHRQLRNPNKGINVETNGSLPHRQLRKTIFFALASNY